MFCLLLVSAAALGAAYYRWSRRRLHRLAREIPSGFKAYPIIGHAYKFLGNCEDHMTALQGFGRKANCQGGYSSVWMSVRLCICITDPRAIDVVSMACLEKDNFTMKILRTATDNASLTAPVNIWHPRRKMVAPFFTLKNLNRMVPLFQEKSVIMKDLLRREAGRGDFSIWKHMTAYTFDSVLEAILGVNTNSAENPEHLIIPAVTDGLALVAKRTVQPWLHPDCIYKRLPVYKQFVHFKTPFNNYFEQIIQKKRNELAACEQTFKDVDSEKHNTFLDTMIHVSGKKEKNFTDIELREEAQVMLVAAYESSAITLSSVAVLLSRFPEVQERLHQELQEVFGDSDRAVTSKDIVRLKYLDVVIKETLRLYPPFPVVMREVQNDVLLPSGTTLVAGSSVMLHIWGTHRNPSYWGADAELFRPERFLEGPLRHPAQFIPFSYSVRNCVGYMFAMLSTKTALVNLVRRYRLLPPAGMAAADRAKPLRVQFKMTMTAVDNYVVRVEERR